MIAALYVDPEGPYRNTGLDLWGVDRDARRYAGPGPVVAHPPCERWGRYWSGGPNPASVRRLKGSDGGCFAHALWCVRTFGGVLEHPEASHAWERFGIRRPSQGEQWISADSFGGSTVCVAQGLYGHSARKLTWLYSCKAYLPRVRKGAFKGARLDQGFASKEVALAARASVDYQPRMRISAKARIHTPSEFRDLLIFIALSVRVLP